MDLYLEEEISEHPWDPSQAAHLEDAHPTAARGRPRIPEQWTRVISVTHDNLDAIEIIVIANDFRRNK